MAPPPPPPGPAADGALAPLTEESAASAAVPRLTPTRRDWLFLLGVVVFGGSSFSGIRLAVETASPAVVAAGRLWVAALFLIIYMVATGRSFPALLRDGRPSREWLFALAIGASGYAGPMFLFPFAQQTVSSMLAGIYMAFMPIATVALASVFADEPLTRRKIVGTFAGLAGVLILIGPGALAGIFTESVIAQLALVLATTGYAVASVITRRAPDVQARSFAAMVLLTAALLATPAAIASAAGQSGPSLHSMGAILYLGVVPTAISTIFIIHMVRSAGAGFLAVGNYATPAAAIIFGIVLFREQLEPRYLLGLAAILAGVFIAQPGPLIAFWRKLQTESGKAISPRK